MDKIKRLFDESLTNDDAFVVCATVDTGNSIVCEFSQINLRTVLSNITSNE